MGRFLYKITVLALRHELLFGLDCIPSCAATKDPPNLTCASVLGSAAATVCRYPIFDGMIM